MYIAGRQVEECVRHIGTAIDIEGPISLVPVAIIHGTLALHVLHLDVALVAQPHRGAQAEPEGGAAGPGGERDGGVGTVHGDGGAHGAQVEVAVDQETDPETDGSEDDTDLYP